MICLNDETRNQEMSALDTSELVTRGRHILMSSAHARDAVMFLGKSRNINVMITSFESRETNNS